MTTTEVASKYGKFVPKPRSHAGRRVRVMPILITLAAVALAGLLGWAAWDIYMGAPWTRDATVRAYVVTMAPEVTGRIVELPVVDNGYIRKGDLLMAIDPTNFTIAVSQAEAAVQQAQASVQNIDAQMAVQQAQISASQAQLDQAQAALVFAQQQATRFQTLAQDGWGTVQNAQQFTSQLHQQAAAVQTARANLNLAQRQVEFAEGAAHERRGECCAGQGSAQASAGESRAHADCLSRRRLRDEPAGATRRLRQCRCEHHLGGRCKLILG